MSRAARRGSSDPSADLDCRLRPVGVGAQPFPLEALKIAEFESGMHEIARAFVAAGSPLLAIRRRFESLVAAFGLEACRGGVARRKIPRPPLSPGA